MGAEMWVDGSVAGPAFGSAGEVRPSTAPPGGGGGDPLTTLSAAVLVPGSMELSVLDGFGSGNEAAAGAIGTTNVQNLTVAEQEHTAQLRDPLVNGGAGTTAV